MEGHEPLLSMTGMTKSFAGVVALDDASLVVGPGEVHALCGENGAGKSTLIKILSGAVQRDSGTVRFAGRDVAFASPLEAQRGQLAAIYQELNLVPYRSVAENIFLGREPRRFGFLDWRRLNDDAAALLARLNVAIDVTQPLMHFNTSIQQMVAIARAVSYRSRLVIMDEPTSSLDEREVGTLFDVIRRLKADGVSVIFISHRLDEIYAICDRITVLRDGRTVRTGTTAEMPKIELVASMLGRDVQEVRRFGATAFGERDFQGGRPLLAADRLDNGGRLRGVSLDIARGEIVGLAGLLGSGRTETARALFGADPVRGGTVTFEGRPAAFAEPRQAIERGIGFSSEDRKVEGIVPEMSVRDNLTLALLPHLSRHGIVSPSAQREVVDRFMKRMRIKASSAEQRIRELSGGNQQKVLLARWLCLNPKLLLLDEPTRGIDVGAKAEIQALIRELSDEGLSVLLISSEWEELIEGCDKVVVLREGQDVATLPRAEVSERALMEAVAHGRAPGHGAEAPAP